MTTAQRFNFDRFDREGRRLEVSGDGDNLTMRVEDPHTLRGVNAVYELDAEAAIRLARDLLERVSSYAECDETVAAITALRELHERELILYGGDNTIPCDEFDWRSLAGF